MSTELTSTEIGWRGYWFVKNILSELLNLWRSFYTKSIFQILNHAGKSTTVLVGGRNHNAVHSPTQIR